MNSVLEKLRAKVKEKIEKKASKQKGYGLYNLPEGVDFFRPQKPGIYHIDILPYLVTVNNHPEVNSGEVWYERTVYIHFGIGDEQLAYICPKTIGKKCPICEQRAKLMKDPNADEELIKQLKPRERQLFNVIDLDNEDDVNKIKIWEVSNYLFGEFLEEEIKNGDDENASFFFYEGGKTLKVRFKQESFGDSQFLKTHRIDFEDREDYGKEILKKTVDLDKILIVLSYEGLEKKFLGIDVDNDEKDTDEIKEEMMEETIEKEDENISISKRKITAIKEDEEEEDLLLQMEEDDENEQDRKNVSRRKKFIVDDEDDDLPPQLRDDDKKSNKSETKCPAGGKFGEDCNSLKECDTCNIWDSCQDKKDEIDSQRRKMRKG